MSLFPWLTLVAIIWLQSISGTNTDFPAYSSHLMSRLSITQVQLNNLAVASDAGKLLAWSSGLAAARLPLWSVLAIGSAIGFIGYGVQFLFLADKLALSYPHFVLLNILAGNSICWVNTSCYVAAMRKFPNDHGTVVGLATSYTGLSAKIYIAIAQVILGNNLHSSGGENNIYLLLNCVVPVAAGLVTAPFLKETKPAKTGNGAGLFSVFVIACATGLYAVVETLVPVLGSTRVPPMILLIMVGLVAGVPLMKAGERRRERVAEVEVEIISVVEVISVVDVEVEEEEGRGVGGEHGVRELMRMVEFWVYFMVYLCGATLGLVYANNLGQISQSRGVQESVLLSISSSFGFFGKLSSAPLSAFARSVVLY